MKIKKGKASAKLFFSKLRSADLIKSGPNKGKIADPKFRKEAIATLKAIGKSGVPHRFKSK